MPNSTKEERLRWIKPILDKRIKIKDMAKVCPFSERTIKYWLSIYRQLGEQGLELKSTRPKSNPNETPIWIKERVIELRKKTKLCALKLHWRLKKQGLDIPVRTVGKIIKKEGLVRKYRVKRIKYKYIKALRQPGELIEIDVKYVPYRVKSMRYYQYTAIDCASRWRYLRIYEEQSNYHSVEFLKEVIERFPYPIQAIKTDNHPIFTNRYTGYLKSSNPFNPKIHSLDIFCQSKDIVHYLIDPGKPAQNGIVERSHRSDQENFYESIKCDNVKTLKYRLKLWNMYYNDLEHCGLKGKTPNQALRLGVQYVLA